MGQLIFKRFAKGTRVRLTHDIKLRVPLGQLAKGIADGREGKVLVPKGTEGTVIWIGMDKHNRKMKAVRVGVKFDGESKPRFFGAGIIVRTDGLTEADIEARRKTPRRQFRYQELGNIRAGKRTLGLDDMSEEEREELRKIATAHPQAAYLVCELRPGFDKPLPDEMDALREARRLAHIYATPASGESREGGVILKMLDGNIIEDDGSASTAEQLASAVTA